MFLKYKNKFISFYKQASNKNWIKNFFQVVFYVLLISQPILDLYWIYNSSVNVFSFNIATLLRLLLIFLLIISSIFVIKYKGKLKYLIIYFVLTFIYFMLHHYNALNFNCLVPNNFSYSWIEELFYIIRLEIPLLIIFFTYHIKLNNKVINYILYFICLFFSLSIIIGNLLHISFISYGDTKNLGSILDWFLNSNKYSYMVLASKGFFFSSWVTTNLILLSPYMYYRFVKTNKWYYYILLFFITLSMFIVGIKATTYSIVLINIIMLLMYIFFLVIKKIKINKMVLVFLVSLNALCFIVYPYSPAIKRTSFDNNFSENLKENLDEKLIDSTEADKLLEKENIGDLLLLNVSKYERKEVLIDYFNKFYKYLGINIKYIKKSYSYTYDPEFWYSFIESVPISERYKNRNIQLKIYNRIKESNNNKLDEYLGITFSRGSKIVTIEQDFIYQYYTLGLVGIFLFLSPYIILVIYSIILLLIKFKEKMNLENCSILLGIGLTLFVSFYSGNIIDTLGVTIILGFMSGFLLKKLHNKSDGY